MVLDGWGEVIAAFSIIAIYAAIVAIIIGVGIAAIMWLLGNAHPCATATASLAAPNTGPYGL